MSLARPLLALLAAALLAMPASAQTADGWSMVGGDAAHTGEAAGPAPPYEEAWRAKVADVVSGPMATDQGVFVLTETALARSDAAAGQFKEVSTREDGPAGPAVELPSELIAFSSGRGKESTVAFFGSLGQVASFTFSEGQRAPSAEVVIRSPAVGGLTYAAFEGAAGILAASRDGALHSIDSGGNSKQWRFKAAGVLEGAPAVSGDKVFVVAQNLQTGSTTVHAVSLATGKQVWRYSPVGVSITASSAAVAGDTVVVGFGDSRVRGLSVDDGRLLWETRVRSGFSPRMVPIAPDDIYIGDLFGHLYRLDAETGVERWVHRVPGNLVYGSPVAVGDAVVVGDRSGQVTAIDTDSGHLVWKQDTGDNEIVGLAADGDRLYASIADDGVIAFAHDPGGTLLDEPSPTTLFLGPALLNFAITAVPMYLVLLFLFRIRRRAGPETPDGWREQ